MTRYEKFMESINTPEKFAEFADNIAVDNWFEDTVGYGFCKSDCAQEKLDLHCKKCMLRVLNEEVE